MKCVENGPVPDGLQAGPDDPMAAFRVEGVNAERVF
jgi:hypothetical protein